ncbi:MAG: MATE family efflux transporter [Ignavibacteriota bacterium]|nr:MAG: MATE family efflux transporter [Chlorobiota bacterium]MBE7477681.1 MATE family efflux transporter [Ignavibacteriales bacterium]MBL1123790.1 MATE family efflux transporter [Ignavibacteriota bacterium]MCE7855973.1 MATE family efflux transporter [Ignavibacteria bacterium CHB3]NUM62765.1 MATE family efflux transporter [Ignavibacteriaceae bacterium]
MTSLKKHILSTFELAYPIIIGQLGIIMMGVVDSLMVGHLSAAHLAAASLGNSLAFILMIIGIGVSLAVTPLVAIAVGANKYDECGIYFRQSLLVNSTLSIFLAFAIFFAAGLIEYFDQPPEVQILAKSYMRIIGFSTLPLMVFQTYKQFIEGFSIMKPAMIIAILANLINAFVNWILIFGELGFPRLELNGAGWATFASRLFMAICIMIYVMKSKLFRQYNVSFHFKNFNRHIIKKILSLGLPSGFQYFFEIGAFSFAVVMVGWLGTKQLAAHQIAINLASISFMAVLGISVAGSIRVGNAVGMKDIFETRRAGFTASLLGAFVMFISGVIFILFRNHLPTLYVQDDQVINYASSLLIIAALFQLSDGTQAVGIGILRGLTDVKIPTAITFIAYWIVGLPIGYLLGFTFDLGVQGVWIGLLLGLTTSAILLTIRFNSRSKHIITV